MDNNLVLVFNKTSEVIFKGIRSNKPIVFRSTHTTRQRPYVSENRSELQYKFHQSHCEPKTKSSEKNYSFPKIMPNFKSPNYLL